MRYVIYMDVFFAVNFFMDLIILVIASKFIKPQSTKKKCVLAALAGTTLTCIVTVWRIPVVILQKIFTYAVIPSVMIFISYRLKNVKEYVKAMGILYLVTFTAAGAVNGLYYFTSAGFYLKELLSFKYLRGINVFVFIFITTMAYFITDFAGKFIKSKFGSAGNKSDIYDVTLVFKGRQVKLKGLYDSGNSLTEPVEGTPVHIAEYDGIRKLLEGVEAKETKIRIVPYKSIGTKKGVLKAIEIDMVCIEAESSYVEIKKAMIGIYQGTVSSTGAYQMILNRSIKKWL